MTKGKFCNRLQEHKEDIKFGKLNAALPRLCPNGEINSINFDSEEIIARQSNSYKAKIRRVIRNNYKK